MFNPVNRHATLSALGTSVDHDRVPSTSVVVPTYDRLTLLERAVASVLSQSWTDLELVIVDDRSNDTTLEWARAIEDDRVSVVERHHCGNVGEVRNAGVAASRGRYVAFLDSDDWWEPGKLEAQLARTPFGWSFGMAAVEGLGPVPLGYISPARLARDILSTRVGVPISTLVVERQLLNQLGGFSQDPKVNFREDWLLAVRLALADAHPHVVESQIATVGAHPGRSTNGVADPDGLSARAYASLASELPLPLLPAAAKRWCWHRWRSLGVSRNGRRSR